MLSKALQTATRQMAWAWPRFGEALPASAISILIVSPQTREDLAPRQVVSCIRAGSHEREFLEIETPVLMPRPAAPDPVPFTTHHKHPHLAVFPADRHRAPPQSD